MPKSHLRPELLNFQVLFISQHLDFHYYRLYDISVPSCSRVARTALTRHTTEELLTYLEVGSLNYDVKNRINTNHIHHMMHFLLDTLYSNAPRTKKKDYYLLRREFTFSQGWKDVWRRFSFFYSGCDSGLSDIWKDVKDFFNWQYKNEFFEEFLFENFSPRIFVFSLAVVTESMYWLWINFKVYRNFT